MRKMTGGVEGISGLIPVNANAGSTYAYTISEALDPAWNRDQLYLTGYVAIDSEAALERHILNAARVKISEKQAEDTTAVSIAIETFLPQLHVYPNPATSTVYIEWNRSDQTTGSGNSRMTVQLVSSAGALVRIINDIQPHMKKTEIDVSGLEAGIYSLELLENDLLIGARPIVIQR
jgi:hypothetical protein